MRRLKSVGHFEHLGPLGRASPHPRLLRRCRYRKYLLGVCTKFVRMLAALPMSENMRGISVATFQWKLHPPPNEKLHEELVHVFIRRQISRHMPVQ